RGRRGAGQPRRRRPRGRVGGGDDRADGLDRARRARERCRRLQPLRLSKARRSSQSRRLRPRRRRPSPAVGPVITSMENKPVLGIVLRGGLRDRSKLPDHYLAELRRVGRRREYPDVARQGYRNVDSMIAPRALYGHATAPVTLVYGDRDRSRPRAREANLALLRDARSLTLPETGRFAALEQPGPRGRDPSRQHRAPMTSAG